jgi:hypothetical protein
MTRFKFSQRVYDSGRGELELVPQLAKRFHPVIHQEQDVFSLVRANGETDDLVYVYVFFHFRVYNSRRPATPPMQLPR